MFGHQAEVSSCDFCSLHSTIEFHPDRVIVHAPAQALTGSTLLDIMRHKFVRGDRHYGFNCIGYNSSFAPADSGDDIDTELQIVYVEERH